MKKIVIEIRSFFTQEKYHELLDYFKKEVDFLGEENQKTYYFDTPEDLRIQKNDNYSKIWMKKGKLHDDHREEIEIKFDTEQFKELEKLFLGLGFEVEIKWFRKRNSFKWQGVDVAIDYTKGYGYIIEFEKMSDKEGEEKTLKFLKDKFKGLNISLTPRDKFDEKFENYKKNWRELTDQNAKNNLYKKRFFMDSMETSRH